MIVIDIGCARYGDHVYSIERLARRFTPDTLYAIDPQETKHPGTPNTVIRREAAWTHDGEIGFLPHGTQSRVHLIENFRVPCFDLAEFIASLPDDEIVLKMDAEGAEYVLLPHLMKHGLDRRLSLLLVEWHQPDDLKEDIERTIACPIEEWQW